MNDYEFTVVESEIAQSLIRSAPGISDTLRQAIIRNITLKIRLALRPAKAPEDAK